MKKVLFSTIVIIGVVICAVGNIAYSFFNVDLDFNTNMEIGAIFTGDYVPVFTSSSDDAIILEPLNADMLATNENTPAITKRGAVNIHLEGTNEEDKTSVTCTFSLAYEDIKKDSYSKYVPSPGVKENNLLEYTIKIIDDENNTILEEKSVDAIKSGDIIVKDLSISTKNEIIDKNYFVIATIYNLNIDQNITNKKYAFKIKTTDVDCKVKK